ncbi:MAG: NAD(+)/NADH kinase [Cyclonatronaceae bacterium]
MEICVIANPEKYAVRDALIATLQWCIEKKIEVFIPQQLAGMAENLTHNHITYTGTEQEAIERSRVIIAVGGDGTMLHTATMVGHSGKKILGINSGKMGFLANVKAGDITRALNHVLEGNFETDRRCVLKATDQNGKTHYALNEFVFLKHSSVSMITLSAWCDDLFINRYWADGLIVSTPTGSTAYNLSSGGPIVYPGTDVMILTPISPHMLTTRPLVLPATSNIRIVADPSDQEILFSNDGQIPDIEGVALTMEIRRSDYTIDLIHLPGQSYFETLREKLMWGIDLREQRPRA